MGDTPVTVSTVPFRYTYLQRVQFACYGAILILFLLGIRGVWRLRPDMGQPFGGIPVSWDRFSGFNINVDVPWNWPGPQSGLRGGDQILRIDGQDPFAFFKDPFPNKDVGDVVTFEVIREDRPTQIAVPVTPFTLERFFEFYGFWFLAGITGGLASMYFIYTTRDEARLVLGLSFLVITTAFFNHGYNGCIHYFCFTWDVPSSVIWHYTYPVMGALLLHFALVFPQPPPWLQRYPRLRFILYLWAVVIGTLYLLTNWVFDQSTIDIVFDLVLLTVSAGALAVMIRPIWSYFYPGPKGRGWTLMLGSVWAAGVALLLGVGILPFLSHGSTMIVTEIFLPLCTVYPLMMVYAVYNVDLIEQLQKEVQIREQYAGEASELRGIRERTLHELADELHNTIVQDARGLQLWVGVFRRRLLPSLTPQDAESLALIEQTLRKIYGDARRIMEGAKLVDFAEEGLTQPIHRLVSQTNESGWGGVDIQFFPDLQADTLNPAVAEDVYWIVRTALNNCLEHSVARHIVIRMQCSDDTLEVTVGDDGRGFNVTEAYKLAGDPTRRHLGIRNMKMRAERIHAEFDIQSGAREHVGTTVWLVVPLPDHK